MAEPNADKVAIVAEVKDKLEAADAAVITDYRGIDVPGMAALRAALRDAGGDFKIYKNTLVRFAAREFDLDIEELLVGPTAIAFIAAGEDGATGDPVPVAKALRAFAKENENLEVKGGLLGDRLLTADDVAELAKLSSREELLAKLAGGLAAPLQQFAGLVSAMPRELAGLLRALIDEGGAADAPETAAATPEAEDAQSDDAETESDETQTNETQTDESQSNDEATQEEEG